MAEVDVHREAGLIVVGEPLPLAPWLPAHHHGEDWDGSTDGLDPDRFGSLAVSALGGPTPEVVLGDLLGLPGRALLAGGPARVEVDDERLRAIARLVSLGAGHSAELGLGSVSPWWTIEAHAVAGNLGPAGTAWLRRGPFGALDPADAVRAVAAQRWHGASPFVDSIASLFERVAGMVGLGDLQVAIDSDQRLDAPPRFPVDPGYLPATIGDGERTSVAVSPADLGPGLFDLHQGVDVSYDADRGSLTVRAPLLEGAYYQAALSHRAVVVRRDAPVPVGVAGMEADGSDAVKADVRVSRHSIGRPLLLRIAAETSRRGPTSAVDAVVAAASLGQAAASSVRVGRMDDAARYLERAAERWEEAGDSDRAAASRSFVLPDAGPPPLAAEATAARSG